MKDAIPVLNDQEFAEATRTLIEQVALEMAHARIAGAAQRAGFAAIEVLDLDAFMATSQMIGKRTVADADADGERGDVQSWSQQVEAQIRIYAALQDERLTMDVIKQHLKNGVGYITDRDDWTAAEAWVDSKFAKLLQAGVVRETESLKGTGVVEIIVPEHVLQAAHTVES